MPLRTGLLDSVSGFLKVYTSNVPVGRTSRKDSWDKKVKSSMPFVYTREHYTKRR